ncbi:MAG TPA: DUF3179 domain-containing (seleno)protein [Thermoanaerobaculales bacterium]|nr:DUF3179 domain-containing (seleno)protein [Thermoanaerobaculales bacterium]HPA81377.1 DUF3179 domain-containing (seleno)protein [Thermoanaerobaculales bacterium]HQL30103.1 DUF3179 domain-containing (seleno)protein [Thermoanaerobaculales bacterium]HQN94788.1 DUF3179 domain-containing (seleno)protein [Thermoanaerobaculales bacterium]
MARLTSLVRSGWWVAVAGGAVVAALLALALRAPGPARARVLGDGRTVASYGFDLTSALVPRDRIVAAGMPRDGLLSLDEPATLTVAEVEVRNHEGRGKFLLPHDRVLGVEIAGEARAYPLRLLRWHEVVNDIVGGREVLVSYNPLSDSAVVSDRSLGGEALAFGVSGLAFNSNMLLYDRRPSPERCSLWSQLEARAIAGPAAADAARLELLPAAIATWEQWLERHPGTRVLAPADRMRTLYKRDPYHSYFGSDVLHFPVDPLPPAGDLALKDRVLIVSARGTETAFALRRIAAAAGASSGAWETTAAGVPLRVHFDLDAGAALVEPLADPGPGYATRQCFWFAWYAWHPEGPPPGI